MSHNSLFGKVEALMRKHRGEPISNDDSPMPAERKGPSPDAWLPVLTDVVQRGSPPPVSEIHSHSENDVPGSSTTGLTLDEVHSPSISAAILEPVETHETPPEPLTEAGPVQTSEPVMENLAETGLDEHAAENLVDELTHKISSLMQEQVAEELRKSLNQSMASLMANLNANVEEIVRQALAEKLTEKDKKPD